ASFECASVARKVRIHPDRTTLLTFSDIRNAASEVAYRQSFAPPSDRLLQPAIEAPSPNPFRFRSKPRGFRDNRRGFVPRRRKHAEVHSIQRSDDPGQSFHEAADLDSFAGADIHRSLRLGIEHAGQRLRYVIHEEIITHLFAFGATSPATSQQRKRDGWNEPPRIFPWTVQVEDPPPCPAQSGHGCEFFNHLSKRVLARAIEGRRLQGGAFFAKDHVRPIVLGARAGNHDSLSAAFGKRADKLDSRPDPIEILRRRPILSGYRVPRQVQQMGRLQIVQKPGRRSRFEQVDRMPFNVRRHLRRAASARGPVDFEASVKKRLQAVASDESARARHEHAPHARKSPYALSRGEITRGSQGHLIPNAGSFHRTPRDDSRS